MSHLLSEDIVVLFAILAIGYAIGTFSVRGISLGTGGVLFIALVFGHFGCHVPREVMELGLLLFVYAVGLQAGPRFFRAFKETGSKYLVIGLVSLVTGMISTLIVGWYLGVRYELVVGLFSGALTNTPALAAAIDLINDRTGGSFASVGYGIAYPFSMLGVVLLIQFLPRIVQRSVVSEEEKWLQEARQQNPALEAKQFLITNPNCDGKSIREVNPRRASDANISRVRRGNEVYTGTPDFVLRLGDVVRAVGTSSELEVLRVLFGETTQEVSLDIDRDIVSLDLLVTDPGLASKTLRELRIIERYGVLITRLRREGIEYVPKGSSILLIGDQIRVVGEKNAVEEFVKMAGSKEHTLEETTMLPFLAGLLVGVVLGNIPISLSHGIEVKFGAAGGAFVVSLILGHFGSVGRFNLYVPQAAKNLSREMGLMLFLAGAGTNAGSRFVEVLAKNGPGLFIGGAVITMITVAIVFLFSHVIYKMNLLSTMGVISACMTNPPGLGAADDQTQTELPTLAYASVYPVALIGKIVAIQILVELLRR